MMRRKHPYEDMEKDILKWGTAKRNVWKMFHMLERQEEIQLG